MTRLEDDDLDDFMDQINDVGEEIPSNPSSKSLIFAYDSTATRKQTDNVHVIRAEKTIKALMDGKIDPEEVDKKESAIKEKQRQAEERRLKKLEDEERRKRHLQRQEERKKWGFVGR
jgi:hypothetical protein